MATDDFYARIPKRRMGAGLLITNAEGLPLLVEPTYKPVWEIPGGIVEAGEEPRTCAAREALEELGLAIEPGHMLVIDHQSRPLPRGDATMVVYDGGILDDPGTIHLATDELRSFRFVPPADLDALTTPTLARRIREALRARDLGRLVEITGDRIW